MDEDWSSELGEFPPFFSSIQLILTHTYIYTHTARTMAISVAVIKSVVFFPSFAPRLSSHYLQHPFLLLLFLLCFLYLPIMAEHQQIGRAPPNIPLVPSTSTSPQSSPPAPLNTHLTMSASSFPQSSNWAQQEHFATLHAVIISMITTVGGYVLFQFQSRNLCPFDEHGNIMKAAFLMLFFYVMALMAEFRLQNQSNYFAIMKQFSPLFGLLVVVLLLFILSLFLGLVASILWAYLAVRPTVTLFQQIIQSLRGIIHYITTDQTATSNLDGEERDPLEIL